jgi:hypothetical protein
VTRSEDDRILDEVGDCAISGDEPFEPAGL